MKKLVEAVLENHSTREVFLFRASCGKCGAEFANKPVPFSKAGMTPSTPEKGILYEALYEHELQCVRQRSIREAAEHLNYCPICKRLICNRCFMICDDLDMCKQCAVRLKEHGRPVLSDVLEITI